MQVSYKDKVLRRISNRLARYNIIRNASIDVSGVKVVCPVVDGNFCRLSEPFMIDILKVLLPRRSGVFVDVGVNMAKTLAVVKALDASREYIGFEPNPACCYYAEILIEKNDFKNCAIIPAGLGDSPGLLFLNQYSSSRFDPSASVVEDFRPGEAVVARRVVPICTFSQVADARDIGGIGLIKIDVEGGELEVLRSLEPVLGRDRPWILIEVLPPYTSENAKRISRNNEIERILDRSGYRIFRIKKNGAGRFVGFSPLSEFGIYDSIEDSDYIFVPQEKTDFVNSVFGF